mgnify:CR=1 FL=1
MAHSATMHWKIDPVQSLNGLSRSIKNKAMRIALNAGASAVKQAVISSAPKDEGHLSKATTIKVYNPGGGKAKDSNVWIAVVGAGSKYKKLKKTKNRKTGKSKVVYRKDKKTGEKKKVYIRPAKYQHFVDAGTKNMTARKYLPAAWSRSKAQFEQTVMRKLQEIIPQLMQQNRR